MLLLAAGFRSKTAVIVHTSNLCPHYHLCSMPVWACCSRVTGTWAPTTCHLETYRCYLCQFLPLFLLWSYLITHENPHPSASSTGPAVGRVGTVIPLPSQTCHDNQHLCPGEQVKPLSLPEAVRTDREPCSLVQPSQASSGLC